MHEQVRKRERDRRGLLHAREAPERPLSVELLYGHAALQRQVRQRVHARVLALVRARPARKPQRERLRLLLLLGAQRWWWWWRRVAVVDVGVGVGVCVGVARVPSALCEAALEGV